MHQLNEETDNLSLFPTKILAERRPCKAQYLQTRDETVLHELKLRKKKNAPY